MAARSAGELNNTPHPFVETSIVEPGRVTTERPTLRSGAAAAAAVVLLLAAWPRVAGARPGGEEAAIPTLPLSFSVAVDGAEVATGEPPAPVRDDAWIDVQVASAERL